MKDGDLSFPEDKEATYLGPLSEAKAPLFISAVLQK